jgi:hypothetical protein
MNGMWRVENDDESSPESYVLDSGNLVAVVIPGLSRVGTHLWTITDVENTRAPTFITTWALPENTPGIEIRRNGIPVYTKTENGGSENTSFLNIVTYTIPEPTIWEFFVDEETTNTTLGPGASRLTCTFPVTSGNIEAASNWKLGDMFIGRDAARYLGGEVLPIQKIDFPGAVSGT